MVSHYYKQDVNQKVLEWNLLLAESGNSNDLLYVAQTYLAMCEPVSAIPYLERAADQGSGAAYQLLGEIYKRGVDVEPSETKAIGYYEESARLGFILSKSRLLHAKRSQHGAWYLPIFVVGVLRLTLESKRLFAKDPDDPHLSLLPCSRGGHNRAGIWGASPFADQNPPRASQSPAPTKVTKASKVVTIFLIVIAVNLGI